jgi:hypothetical protein
LSFRPDGGHKARQVPARLLKKPLGEAVTFSGRLRKLFAQTGEEGFLKAGVAVLQKAKSAKMTKARNHILVLNCIRRHKKRSRGSKPFKKGQPQAKKGETETYNKIHAAFW